MPAVQTLLQRFDPISLGEMDGVKLQDRMDTKFVFSDRSLGQVLEALLPHYRLLEVNGVRGAEYRSLYFDSPAPQHFLDHHNGRTLRSKVRFREYVGSGLCFLEVKRKTGTGRTDKARRREDAIPVALTPDQATFIANAKGGDEKLVPVLWNSFTRLTLVSRTSPERLTIDIGLRYTDGSGTNAHATQLSGVCVAELKQERADRTSPFARVMRQLGIRPSGMSKYCIGMLLLHADLKHNMFKDVLRKLDRIRAAA
ncbi:MAG: polyphosphate polymerase domain-containing protein [Flavobacteriales bacterium]|nr:polyphosphate polymerase domain-containing protein [Flavobacteriales bacterium]